MPRIGTDRKILIYCETAEQKRLIEADAHRTGRTVSRHGLYVLLGTDTAESWKALAEQRGADLDAARRDLLEAKSERDVAKRIADEAANRLRVLDLELRTRDLLHAKEERDFVLLVDLLSGLLRPADDVGAPFVLESDLIVQSGRITDPDFVRLLQRRLASLVAHGALQRLMVNGQPAYALIGPVPPPVRSR